MLYSSIYFIHAKAINGILRAIKIGYSDDVKHRLIVLQYNENNIATIHNVEPFKLEIRHQFLVQRPIARDIELDLHNRFCSHAILGEWFRPSVEIEDWIKVNERKIQGEYDA